MNNKYLVAVYIEDVKCIMKFFNLSDGTFLFERRMKKGAMISLSDGLLSSSEENEFFYMEKSFLEPGTIYHHDFSKNQTQVI